MSRRNKVLKYFTIGDKNQNHRSEKLIEKSTQNEHIQIYIYTYLGSSNLVKLLKTKQKKCESSQEERKTTKILIIFLLQKYTSQKIMGWEFKY